MIAALWLAAWVTPASAQDDGGGGLGCGIVTVFPSAQKDLLQEAATDNTSLYGAVGTAERKVLPAMHAHEGVGIMVFEQHVLAGALHVPAEAGGDCPYSVIRSPVDLTASNWALAWTGEDVGVFYNASVTGAYAAGSGATRAMTGTVATLASIYYGLAAPFFPTGSKQSDDGIIT